MFCRSKPAVFSAPSGVALLPSRAKAKLLSPSRLVTLRVPVRSAKVSSAAVSAYEATTAASTGLSSAPSRVIVNIWVAVALEPSATLRVKLSLVLASSASIAVSRGTNS
ncbi:hypothetical protein D3C84_629900 [compost metagenome]